MDNNAQEDSYLHLTNVAIVFTSPLPDVLIKTIQKHSTK